MSEAKQGKQGMTGGSVRKRVGMRGSGRAPGLDMTGERGVPENNGRMEPRRGWRDMPVGGAISAAGSAIEYQTGDWRSIRPLHSKERCINCLMCWVYCPDAAIMLKDGKVEGIDYAHCKGCGICAKECPQRSMHRWCGGTH